MLSSLTTHTDTHTHKHTQIKTETRKQKYTRRCWESFVTSITLLW